MGTYRECTTGVRRASFWCGIGMELIAFAKVIFFFSTIRENSIQKEFLSIVEMAVSGLCLITIFVIEKRTTYIRTNSENETVGDGVEINR